jgi:hypothetical protein
MNAGCSSHRGRGHRVRILSLYLCCPTTRRSLSGVPLAVFDTRLLLPRPEWEMIAQQARSSRNFAMELAGKNRVNSNADHILHCPRSFATVSGNILVTQSPSHWQPCCFSHEHAYTRSP